MNNNSNNNNENIFRPIKKRIKNLKEYISKIFRYDLNEEGINKKRTIYFFKTNENIVIILKKIIKKLRNQKNQEILDIEKYIFFIDKILNRKLINLDNKKNIFSELIKNYNKSIKNFKKQKENIDKYKIYVLWMYSYKYVDNIYIDNNNKYYIDNDIVSNMNNINKGGGIFRRYKVKRTLKKQGKYENNKDKKTKKKIVRNIDKNLRLFSLLKNEYKDYNEGNFIYDYIINHTNENKNMVVFVDLGNKNNNSIVKKIINIMKLFYKYEHYELNIGNNSSQIKNSNTKPNINSNINSIIRYNKSFNHTKKKENIYIEESNHEYYMNIYDKDEIENIKKKNE